MRLTATEKQGIKEVLEPLGEVRLCGSRVHDSRMGGDIDLLLIVVDSEERERIRGRKHYLLSEIKARIGEQRVDLTIISPERITEDPLIASLYEGSVTLAE